MKKEDKKNLRDEIDLKGNYKVMESLRKVEENFRKPKEDDLNKSEFRKPREDDLKKSGFRKPREDDLKKSGFRKPHEDELEGKDTTQLLEEER